LRPLDSVDLVLTATSENAPFARTVLQRITVLAIGRLLQTGLADRVKPSLRDYTDVTLLMLPQEAEVVALALQTGAFTLTLREPRDDDTVPASESTRLGQLLDNLRTDELSRKRSLALQAVRTRP
jgi:pilus assembly protein CpaB